MREAKNLDIALLILLGIMSVHYGGVFSVPGQFLFAYLLSKNNEEKKYGWSTTN